MEKPEAASFKLGRKLIFVPLIFLPPNNDSGLSSLVEQYWIEATEQVHKLANTLDGVRKVYHELVPAGTDGLAAMAKIQIGSHGLVETMVKSGASLEDTEDQEALTEFLDWGHCLSLRLESPKVFSEIYNNYTQAQKKRNEAIGQRIDESLKNDELGLVLLREEHRVQFPHDIQVFYVAPPALDALTRYLRNQLEKATPETDNQTDSTQDAQDDQGDLGWL